MSLRLRLTLLNSLILALVGGTLVISVYAMLVQGLQRELDESLRERARLYGASSDLVFERGMGQRRPRLVLPDLQRFSGPSAFIQLADREGTIQAHSESLGGDTLPLSEDALHAAVNGQEWLETVDVDGQPLRQLVTPLRPSRVAEDSPTLLVIQVARPLLPIEQTLRTLRTAILVVGGAGALVALVAGWILARAALHPIEDLATTADAIGAARDFGRRVPVPDPPHDEIGRLAVAFNRMLDELQASHEQLAAALAAQRRFVADASHELRTPLATVRGNIDFLRHIAADGQATERRQSEVLEDLAAETERMSRLVGDLLLLAQADAGQHLTLRPMNVGEVVRDAARAARHLAHGVTLHAGGIADDLWVRGHPDRLHQVVLILLDNALRMTPPGGQVTLTAARTGDGNQVELRVADTGPGIAPADQSRVFDRFFRGAGARSGEGTGLGLAIARWIVEEHAGSISVTSTPGRGATFVVRLPAVPAPLAEEEPLPLEPAPVPA